MIIPNFERTPIYEDIRDGYWIESGNFSSPDIKTLVASGLRLGEIYEYISPGVRRLIQSGIKEPVGMDKAPVFNNGLDNLFFCYQLYGPGGTIHHADPDGGKIDWIERHDDGSWERHYIGRHEGIHRIRVGHFTTPDHLQVAAFPIVSSIDVHAVIPIVLFTASNDPRSPWDKTVVNVAELRMLHGVAKLSHPTDTHLDAFATASDEGVTIFFWSEEEETFVYHRVGDGEDRFFSNTGFKGSGDLDVGKIQNDHFASVVAIEPFHGNVVSLYHRPPGGEYNRTVLDIFGTPNENGEGTGHSVLAVDFDGDGDDEFLVGLRGPDPWQGVFYYKIVDIENGLVHRWKVSDDSAARIIPFSFDDSHTGFATVSYNTDKYFHAEKQIIAMFQWVANGSVDHKAL